MSNYSNIKLIRIDERLIHGQVVTQWLNKVEAQKIIIVDKFLSTNEFLSNVYVMAAPAGTDVIVLDPDAFVKRLNNNELNDRNYLVLFKLVDNLKQCFDKGFKPDEIQIGNVGSKDGRKVVYQSVALSEKEAKDLVEMSKSGIKIYFQQVPGEKAVGLNEIISKSFPDLN